MAAVDQVTSPIGDGAGPHPQSGPRAWRDIAGDALFVPWQVLRLFGRHFPALIAVTVAALVLHDLVLVLAVSASAAGALLGQAVLVCAPLCILTGYVLILRIVRPSLPTLAVATASRASGNLPAGTRAVRARINTMLSELGALLIPFLLVYATTGQLKADAVDYADGVRDAVDNLVLVHSADNPPFDGSGALASRSLWGLNNPWLWVLVVGTFTMRTVLPWLIKQVHIGALGFVAAYSEALWMIAGAPQINSQKSTVIDWMQGRAIIVWVKSWWQTVLDHLGPLVGTVQWIMHLLGLVLSGTSALIVVPLSWLSMGAVVYGELIDADESLDRRIGWTSRVRARWERLSGRTRKAAGDFSGGLNSRFGQLLNGLRMMFSSGLVSMGLFCLLFQGAEFLAGGLWLLERKIIGPHDLFAVWIPLSNPLELINDTLTTILLLLVVAAASDRATRARRQRTTSQPN
ncbi:MAG: hypothetical protein ACR2P2_02080 [Nakamurella sp.]